MGYTVSFSAQRQILPPHKTTDPRDMKATEREADEWRWHRVRAATVNSVLTE